MNSLQHALHLCEWWTLALVEQAVFKALNGCSEKPSCCLFGSSPVNLFVQQPFCLFSVAFQHGKTVRQLGPTVRVDHRIEVRTGSRWFLTMKRNASGPVMQPFIAGPLLGCTVKDNRHGTALGNHQLLKPVVERCFDALVLQCQAVVKVENGEGGVVHVLRPVIGCSSVQRTKSLIVQHGSANVPNQMLDLHVVVAR